MKKPKPIVTREWLRDKVAEQPERVIARALIAIYERQTSEEQIGGYTKFSNGRGFSGADAKLGTKCAIKAAIAGRLEPWMVKIWSSVTRTGFPKICKYARQLNEIAEAKRNSCNHIYSRSIGIDQCNRKCELCGQPEPKQKYLIVADFAPSQPVAILQATQVPEDFFN